MTFEEAHAHGGFFHDGFGCDICADAREVEKVNGTRHVFDVTARSLVMDASRAIDDAIMRRNRWPVHILANDWRPVVCGNQVIYERACRA